MVEMRWCPFKRSKELYYRNKDKRFIEYSEETFFEIGKILTNNDTITCNNCPLVVNQYLPNRDINIQPSPLIPLLDYIETIIHS